MNVLFKSVNVTIAVLFCSYVFIEAGGYAGHKLQRNDARQVIERAKMADLNESDRRRLNKLCDERLNFKTSLYSCPRQLR